MGSLAKRIAVAVAFARSGNGGGKGRSELGRTKCSPENRSSSIPTAGTKLTYDGPNLGGLRPEPVALFAWPTFGPRI